MTRPRLAAALGAATLTIAAIGVTPARAQNPPNQGQSPANCAARGAPATISPERLADGRVTFRLCAPEATTVGITSPDHAAIRFAAEGGSGATLTRDAMGVWSGTTAEPVPPGSYRYNFQVNGARVPDPRATRFSEERTGINSLLEVPGPAGFVEDFNPEIPHGVVSEVEYSSESLGVKRRAHVYTPPGYMKDAGEYPVLYLVHGAGDNDDAWSTVGQANNILDNLIAAGTARPMIVVMPFGHTPERQGAGAPMLNNQDFGNDLHQDLIPYIEANFRTLNDPGTRAMAGLSMGGAHTLRHGLTRPELFGYLGVFSMGLAEGEDVSGYAAQHEAALRRAADELRLLYFAMGTDDFLYDRVAPTRALFDQYGIEHLYNETDGGHTWINWRRYLADFLPRLFQ